VSDPYRSASPLPCPSCKAPLIAREGSFLCDRACGEWLDREHASLRAVSLANDSGELLSFEGFKDPIASCPECAAELEGRIWNNAVFRRCARHGVWLEEWARARFHKQVAAASPRERTILELAERMRTDEGRLEIARRLLALERRVELLENK
jgi:Zn-finger nucleic acid-binding protein